MPKLTRHEWAAKTEIDHWWEADSDCDTAVDLLDDATEAEDDTICPFYACDTCGTPIVHPAFADTPGLGLSSPSFGVETARGIECSDCVEKAAGQTS